MIIPYISSVSAGSDALGVLRLLAMRERLVSMGATRFQTAV